MNLQLASRRDQTISSEVVISGSKSESNRLLILQQLFPSITIQNLSDSDDTHHLQEALSEENKKNEIADIGHAGTAMRFLTAFFATQEGVTKILQGSERMHNRPIEILVNALRDLDVSIEYLEKQGYPPIKITGKNIVKNTVAIDGNVSSQYISALMLIAPSLKNGLTIQLNGIVTSVSYIEMTLSLLHKAGVSATFIKDSIKIEALKEVASKNIIVESDWSSASYFYSLIALSKIGATVTLTAYQKDSLQGDSCLATIYKNFGVSTVFKDNTIVLTKQEKHSTAILSEDLKNAPDIAQTIAVTCFGLGIACDLTGLHTLKIKETDRLEALKKELTKLGANISITSQSLHLKVANSINRNITIATYNDHRMAMSFAPLALKTTIIIADAQVVSKSYLNFWEDMQQVGLETIKVK
ncbi:3-phosphoshikimate 1-carboxyvinyltransferase [Tenacibaculum finnmarkense genomovar finnmarkense]|uniref:3-phosphoshikimate 1-carboxyvinyltransferase n=3 Tax=Tenacibaculum finnmarkense TaxID=2781243 RepID=A0A2I2MA82_9FLAO|nr:3-phosphoshikimate 1-carboxyvinyltransferase [Tenacibaculum finnmarkense]ALU75635.1 3-phosphoshikimate 1-carboxyvinyltransferase [Tenacibaculum dicentrarchi]MBE7633060.1 3-phosphoshikimate 1-carboxyvinyltransferase [Tenacibaculum finnmarkense genomovar ulcerans]MBE7646881.1 3-phosphoshikimate 1-carboxyvinyltransferase [Tenacibaculum finnmarkense genomovar ulcerans]MBE7651926.1 3-phosphoshikimate 1-carboxyvinyltransferase [Tenacibaculum finnmarkense genomovar finnmarkense]MBE7659111.1 3-phos